MSGSRAAMYVFLGQSFVCPKDGFVVRLSESLDVSRSAELGDEVIFELGRVADGLDEARGLPLDRVQGEYTRLFINAFPHLPCPPYESAYRSRSLIGKATELVAATYREWGLEVDDKSADHVGAELEFMAFLIRLSLEDAHTDTTDAQKAFFRDHIMKWMPEFAADLDREASLGLYGSVARTLTTFLVSEGRILL